MLQRRARISSYAKNRLAGFDDRPEGRGSRGQERYADIDLSRTFDADDQRFDDPATPEELKEILARMGKYRAEDELNCGACGYDTCLDHALAISQGLAEVEMCLPYTIEQLRDRLRRAGGVPPLSGGRQGGAREDREAGQHGPARRRHRPRGQQPPGHPAAARQPAARGMRARLADCTRTSRLIVDQANRCKRIISGLLNFARQSRVVRQPTDLAELVGEGPAHPPASTEGVSVEVAGPPRRPGGRDRRATRSSRCSPTCSPTPSTRCPTAGRVTVTLDDSPEDGRHPGLRRGRRASRRRT